MEITVKMSGDIARFLESAKKPILEAASRAMSVLLIKHFRDRNRTRARRSGWPKTNYWADVAQTVTSEADGDKAVATIAKEGVRLHWLGGVVRPKNGHKALAIPADPSVQGVWPSEYRGKPGAKPTFLVWKKGENTGMIATREKKGKGIIPLWWLVSKTTHQADPSVIPEKDEFSTAISKACNRVIKALQSGQIGAGA